MWYGPSGIGAARGLEGYYAHHAVPFLTAFPDRAGIDHYVNFADGPYALTGGWPSVGGTHTGPGWLGLPATGKAVGMRVMDFYRRDGDRLAENWIPVDIAHILFQLGTDVFQRVRHLMGDRRPRLS